MSRKRRDPAGPPAEAPQEAEGGAPPVRGPEAADLVLVAHADTLAEAEAYRAALATHGIAAVLEGEGEAAEARDPGVGVPVLVPEERADEAAELIAELESTKTEGIALDEKDDIFDEEGDELEDLDELEDKDGADDGLDDEEDDVEEEDDDEEEEESVDEEDIEEEEEEDDDDEDEDDEWEEDDDEDEDDEDGDDEDDEDWEDDDDDEEAGDDE